MESKHGKVKASQWKNREVKLAECSLYMDADSFALHASLAAAIRAAKAAVKKLAESVVIH